MATATESTVPAVPAEGGAPPSSSNTNRPKMVLSPQSTALEICAGFFRAMDLDRNGFIEESEVKIIATVAFDETEDQAAKRWHRMLTDMDTNHDSKISHDEYVAWWMENTKDKTITRKKEGSDTEVETYFAEGYASFLLRSLLRITSVKTAHDLCDAFFETMDANDDGFLVEDEVKNIGKWAFAAKEEEARSTWVTMRTEMDTNRDGKISKEEYATFWMAQSKTKIQPEDGMFVPGYRKYLLSKLGKLRAGKRRQEQVKVWEKDRAEWDKTHSDNKNEEDKGDTSMNDGDDDDGKHHDELNSKGVDHSPDHRGKRKRTTRISFSATTKDGNSETMDVDHS